MTVIDIVNIYQPKIIYLSIMFFKTKTFSYIYESGSCFYTFFFRYITLFTPLLTLLFLLLLSFFPVTPPTSLLPENVLPKPKFGTIFILLRAAKISTLNEQSIERRSVMKYFCFSSKNNHNILNLRSLLFSSSFMTENGDSLDCVLSV